MTHVRTSYPVAPPVPGIGLALVTHISYDGVTCADDDEGQALWRSRSASPTVIVSSCSRPGWSPRTCSDIGTVEAALTADATAILELEDEKGRRYLVSTDKVAYVEIGESARRAVGFLS